jgi:hypothetical protein
MTEIGQTIQTQQNNCFILLFLTKGKDEKKASKDKVCNPNRTPAKGSKSRDINCSKLSICCQLLSMLYNAHFEISKVIL